MTPLLLGSVISPWIALPLAAVAVVLIAWHSTGLDRRTMPVSRRRIRQANAWVMMLGAPLFAAGVSLVNAQDSPRAFVLIWTATSMLVILCVLLAVVDALNTLRLASHERRRVAASAGGMLTMARRAAGHGAMTQDTPQSTHDD